MLSGCRARESARQEIAEPCKHCAPGRAVHESVEGSCYHRDLKSHQASWRNCESDFFIFPPFCAKAQRSIRGARADKTSAVGEASRSIWVRPQSVATAHDTNPREGQGCRQAYPRHQPCCRSREHGSPAGVSNSVRGDHNMPPRGASPQTRSLMRRKSRPVALARRRSSADARRPHPRPRAVRRP